MSPGQKANPEHKRRYYSVDEVTEVLGVSKVYMYRMVKGKGPESGVFRMKGKSGGADLIRIDLEKFLMTQSMHSDKKPHDPVTPLMPETLQKRIREWMGKLGPIRTEVNDIWNDLERMYDELAQTGPEADDDERPQ